MSDPSRMSETAKEAVRLATEVIERLQGTEQHELLARAFVARANAVAPTEPTAALEDFDRAAQLTPDFMPARYGTAQILYRVGDAAAALHHVDRIRQEDRIPPVRALRARLLFALERPAEAATELRLAIEAAVGFDEREWLLLDLLETALEANQVQAAEEIAEKLDSPASREDLAQLMRARLSSLRGDIEAAHEHYARALDAAGRDVLDELNIEFGMFLLRQGESVAAAELLEAGNAAEHSDRSRRALAQALYQAGRYAQVAELVERLDEEGEAPSWALELGASLALKRDDIPRAIEYLEQLRKAWPRNSRARIHLAYGLLRERQRDRALEVLGELEAYEDLDGQNLMRLAELLLWADERERALQAAYRAIRRHPRDPDLQLGYVGIFLRREAEEGELDVENVGPDTWVQLKEDGTGRTVEFVITTHVPLPGREYEIGLDDPRATLLLGRSVGETVVFREGMLDEVKYTVSDIKHAYVHAFQTILLNFPTQHPSHHGLQSFRVGESPTVEDFGPILQNLRSREEWTDAVLQYYAEHGLPLGFVTTQLNIRLRVALRWFRDNPDRVLFIERGDIESIQTSLEAATIAEAVVAAHSALLTLQQLELLDLLPELYDRVVAPRSLLDELQDELANLREDIRRGGARGIVALGDKILPVERSVVELRAEADAIQSLIGFIDANIELLPRPFEALDERAETLREVIGPSSFDAFALAGGGRVLYADDLWLCALTRNEKGALGFSTYSLLQRAHQENRLSADDYHAAVAKLIDAGYAFVPVTPDLLFHVFESDGYQVGRRFLRVLDRIGAEHASLESAVAVVGGLLRRVLLSPVDQLRRDAVANAAFSRLLRGRNPRDVAVRLNAVLRGLFELLPLEYRRLIELFRAVSEAESSPLNG